MKVEYTPDMITPFSGLYGMYVKILARAGIVVQPKTKIDASSIIVSEDIAMELYQTIIMHTIKSTKYLFTVASLVLPDGVKKLEQVVREKAAQILDDYGPHVDITLPSKTIIILDDVLPEFGSIQEPQEALDEYLALINVPNETVGRLN